MELRESISFCTAVRLGSITEAAKEMGIGQPTVTTHIKKLERELGKALLDRMKRPAQPTLAGAKLAELATPLLKGLDALINDISEAEEREPVKVGATHGMIPRALLEVVAIFRSMYPSASLQIRSGTRDEVLEMVREGEVDVAIVPGSEKDKDFHFQALSPYELVLITPRPHPLLQVPLQSLTQIADWPLILGRPTTYSRRMVDGEFKRKGLSYQVVVELDSMDMRKRYVALALGFAIGERLAIDPADEEELGVVSLATIFPVDQVGMVTLRGKLLSKPTQNFVSAMINSVARPMNGG